MKKKKLRERPNWDLIRDRMMESVVDILTRKWNIPIILDVFEYKKIPLVEFDCDGCVGCVFDTEGGFYIDHIAIKKQKKEENIYILAHELGHIVDFSKLYPKDLIEYAKVNRAAGVRGCSGQLTTREKRVIFEGEKRAYSEGLILLQQAGLRNEYYLQRFLKSRQKDILVIAAILFHVKKRKRVFTTTTDDYNKGLITRVSQYVRIDSMKREENTLVRVHSVSCGERFRKK